MNWKKMFPLYLEATRLSILYGMIARTPAIEIKKMKLRQLRREMKVLLKQIKKEGRNNERNI